MTPILPLRTLALGVVVGLVLGGLRVAWLTADEQPVRLEFDQWDRWAS